jgi:serine/threonine protein kinase
MPDSQETLSLTEDPLGDLVLRWYELRLEGRAVSIEELCAGCPEFVEKLKKRIEGVAAMERILGLAPAATLASPLAETDPFATRWSSGAAATPSAATVPGFPLIAGYEILSVLGRGGMGVVYKARQLKLNRLVALKMVRAGSHAGPEELARFRSEAEAVARLKHPNVVQIYEIGDCGGQPYFSMELVEGVSLAQELARSLLPAGQTARLIEVLARAIHSAHQQGIIHRDLKPANVLLPRANGKWESEQLPQDHWSYAIPKIADFGLAKRLDSAEGQTQTGAIVGTPSYLAPEQAKGKVRQIGPLADVYSLGAILYEMLAGRPPFRGETTLDILEQVRRSDPVPPSQVQPRVPRDLETICLKCLEKEPGKRYATAEALAEDLHRFRSGQPILARPTPLWERGVKWAKRKPALASLLAVSTLAVVSLLVVSLWYNARLETALRDAKRASAEAHRKAGELLVANENFQVANTRQHRAKRREQAARQTAEKKAREAHTQRAEAERQSRRAGREAEKAAKARAVAEGALANSRRRLALNYIAYGRACSAAARIATANSHEAAVEPRTEFRKIAGWLSLLGDVSVKQALSHFQASLKTWKNGPPPSRLKREALALAHSCRKFWLNSVDKEVPEIGRQVRERLYQRACAATRKLADAKGPSEVQRAHQDFWELYWGELAIVESRAVEKIMIRFGESLASWNTGPAPVPLRPLAAKLEQACAGHLHSRP